MPAASPQFVVSQDAKRAHSATTVLVQFQVRTESREAFAKLMQSVKLNLPQVPGCLEASVFISEGQPLRYVLVEQWESAARHAAHVRALQDSGEWRAIEQHLDGAPTVEYLLEQ
ncbi:antibiotic biosynthesis monooxygenase [Diaphorobacter aerolatus]|uniref:Antibiotic biosynthesis monooxygenase n=2 Tax=Diaphorobacter aerolatus TaxID=1288495 RepID=A0A7H0GQM7_9BURK|nr:antibiotic biosynthesis monooxygenase [Diaphorobacter aerolatus]